MDQTTLIIVASLAFLLAGIIKGISGIGLPSAAIAFMVLVIDPRSAIALVMFPMLGTNLWQSYRTGYYLRTAKRYWLFALILFVGVLTTSQVSKDFSNTGLLWALSIAIIIFVAVSWKNLVPEIDPKYDRLSQVFFAVFAGGIGGLTAAWGPPMAMYMATKKVGKTEFVRATGFMILVGSIPLTFSYINLGFLDRNLSIISAAMLIPTLVGFTIGEHVRKKLSIESFRKIILIVFLLLALNLIRRALMGA